MCMYVTMCESVCVMYVGDCMSKFVCVLCVWKCGCVWLCIKYLYVCDCVCESLWKCVCVCATFRMISTLSATHLFWLLWNHLIF